MTTYRKPKKPQGFKDGGAVPADDIVAPVDIVIEPHEPDLATARFSPASSVPADAPMPAPEPGDDDAVARAIEGHRRAEELQRQQQEAPPDPLAAYSPFWRENIRAHPYLLDPNNVPVVGYYLHRATKAGINFESPAMLDAILDGLRAEAGMTERAQELAAPAPPKPAIPAQARQSLHPGLYSAPGNPQGHSFSGQRTSGMIDRKLTAEERQIAKNSFSATDMTDEQKERLYWQNREKMRRMQESGEYRRTTEQSG